MLKVTVTRNQIKDAYSGKEYRVQNLHVEKEKKPCWIYTSAPNLLFTDNITENRELPWCQPELVITTTSGAISDENDVSKSYLILSKLCPLWLDIILPVWWVTYFLQGRKKRRVLASQSHVIGFRFRLRSTPVVGCGSDEDNAYYVVTIWDVENTQGRYGEPLKASEWANLGQQVVELHRSLKSRIVEMPTCHCRLADGLPAPSLKMAWKLSIWNIIQISRG